MNRQTAISVTLTSFLVLGCTSQRVNVMPGINLHIPTLKPQNKDPALLNTEAHKVLFSLPPQSFDSRTNSMDGFKALESMSKTEISEAKELDVQAAGRTMPIGNLAKLLPGKTISFAHPYIGSQSYKFDMETYFFAPNSKASISTVSDVPYKIDGSVVCLDFNSKKCIQLSTDTQGNIYANVTRYWELVGFLGKQEHSQSQLNKVVMIAAGDVLGIRNRALAYEDSERKRMARDLNTVVDVLGEAARRAAEEKRSCQNEFGMNSSRC